MHLPDLIRDLGFILMTAAAVILLCRQLKQPVVLGYLIAGFLLGPHVPLLPTVTDTKSLHVWAEIGVIFLLFGLGLEFSFKKLASVGKSAAITAIFEVVFMLGLGYFVGQLFGWTKMDALFLGGILAISSTTIIVRAIDELGLKTRRFVSLVFGVLVVEDLVAILILVLLSTMGATQTLSGIELVGTTAKLVFFLILWFVVGIYAVPAFLSRVRGLMTNETMLIVAVGLCLLMVLLATSVGFSPALGAFVMGSILAETREGKTIENIIVPVKDLFAAIFFVSVGMLIDPKVIGEHFLLVVTISLLTVFGKFFSTVVGAMLSGQSLRHSVQAGMSLAQIGEFSFIIATLGISLKVTSDFIYPIAVAVSAVTTFTTPYQIRYADSFVAWIERRLSPGAHELLEKYRLAASGSSSETVVGLFWRLYGIKVILNSVVIVAITLGVTRAAFPFVLQWTEDSPMVRFGMCFVTVIFCAPFFWAVMFGAPSSSALKAAKDLSKIRSLQFGVVFVRTLISILLLSFIVARFFSSSVASGLVILIFAAVLILLSRPARSYYRLFEEKFLTNLQDRETYGAVPVSNGRHLPELAPWDAAMAEFVLSPDTDLVAKTLMTSQLKEKFGITIAMIERGQRRIMTPGRNELLLPYDRLFVIGDETQLELARQAIEGKPHLAIDLAAASVGLDSLLLDEHSPFLGRPIRECGLREKINGLIVGIEREGKRILSPDSAMELQQGDLVWIVGDRNLIKQAKA